MAQHRLANMVQFPRNSGTSLLKNVFVLTFVQSDTVSMVKPETEVTKEDLRSL
jgi:hypothetical protein